MNLIDNQLKHELYAKEFYDQLYIALEKTELKDFHFYIFNELYPLISLSIDLADNKPIKNLVNINFGYKQLISEGKDINNISNQLLLHRFKNRSFYRLKASIYKYMIKISSLFYKDNSLFIKVSNNEILDTIDNNKLMEISIFPFLNSLKNKKKNTNIHYQEIGTISEILIFYINKFNNKFRYSSKLKTFVSNLVNNIYNDLLSIQNYDWKKINTIYSSSGGNYPNMLCANVAKKNNIKVVRAAHGGERIFFQDSFWDYELINVDEYISYAPIYKNYINKFKKTNIKSTFAISNYYSSLFNNNSFSYSNSKILIIGQSYIGEARQFYGCKLLDQNSFVLEKLIVRSLISISKKPIYKVHPKGFLNKKLLKSILNIEFDTSSLRNSLKKAEIVIVTSIGTAAIEALLSRKKVIYIDIGIRETSEYFCDLRKLIKTIYLPNNLNIIDFKEILNSTIKLFENCEKDYEKELEFFFKKYFSSI